MAVSQARLIACHGAEKKSPHAFSTVVVVNAVSRPPMTIAVRMASAVTVTASPSITAKRNLFHHGRDDSGGEDSGPGDSGGAVDSAASLIAPLLVRRPCQRPARRYRRRARRRYRH